MVVLPDREPDVYTAINHRVRRQVLDLLTNAERSVSDIAAHFEMSRPAISQHLRVLLNAGLVTERRHGRERRLQPCPRTTRSGAGLDLAIRAVLGRPPPASSGAPI